MSLMTHLNILYVCILYRFKKWLKNIGNDKLLLWDPQTIYNKFFICGAHFACSSFTNALKKID